MLGDQRDLQAGVELRAPAYVDERQAARDLDDAPRPDIQPQLPQQPREVHDAREQQVATPELFVGQMRRHFLGIHVCIHVVTSRLYGAVRCVGLRWLGYVWPPRTFSTRLLSTLPLLTFCRSS